MRLPQHHGSGRPPARRAAARRRMRWGAAVALLLCIALLWRHNTKLRPLEEQRYNGRSSGSAAAGAGTEGAGDGAAALAAAIVTSQQQRQQQQQQEAAAEGRSLEPGLHERDEPRGLLPPAAPMASPAVIVFCYNRPRYLEQTLASLASLEGLSRFAVYVSQDGEDPGVARVVAAAAPRLRAAAARFEHWQKVPRVPALGARQLGHAWLAQHYRWGLGRVFGGRGHSHAVVVEDDMLFSPGGAGWVGGCAADGAGPCGGCPAGGGTAQLSACSAPRRASPAPHPATAPPLVRIPLRLPALLRGHRPAAGGRPHAVSPPSPAPALAPPPAMPCPGLASRPVQCMHTLKKR